VRSGLVSGVGHAADPEKIGRCQRPQRRPRKDQHWLARVSQSDSRSYIHGHLSQVLGIGKLLDEPGLDAPNES